MTYGNASEYWVNLRPHPVTCTSARDWALPRSALVADVLIIAGQRDEWRLRAERAERIADEAVAVAHRYAEQLEAEQARCDALLDDWNELIHG